MLNSVLMIVPFLVLTLVLMIVLFLVLNSVLMIVLLLVLTKFRAHDCAFSGAKSCYRFNPDPGRNLYLTVTGGGSI